ncbi:hypothetical protein BaRGS_00010267 [Batillaria attramentaria]|uniref:Noggin n=1 Tax=Batillaria attramentaria TaxID=370345 RepID=A0ABD0LGZ0_9CAEN
MQIAPVEISPTTTDAETNADKRHVGIDRYSGDCLTMRWPEPHTLAVAFLHLLLLWSHVLHQARAAFQLPPFLQTLSEQSLSRSQVSGADRVYSLPQAVPNVPNIRRFTPRKKHLKTHKLMRRLRKDFDPFWMSVERPADADEETAKEATVDPTLVRAVDRLNFTLRSPDGTVLEIEESVTHVLSAWLLQRSNCRVHYVWDDLGILYWPRWVRRGFCQAGDSPASGSTDTSFSSTPSLSSSCSWPPGMHCVPAESRRIRILRWQCRHNKAFNNWSRRYKNPKRRRQQERGSPPRPKRSAFADKYRNQTDGSRNPEESNETENWSSKPWKERRRKLSMRCKWKKIPYPVTDDCFCSC